MYFLISSEYLNKKTLTIVFLSLRSDGSVYIFGNLIIVFRNRKILKKRVVIKIFVLKYKMKIDIQGVFLYKVKNLKTNLK